MSREQSPLGAPLPGPAGRARRDPSTGQVNEATDPGTLDGETVNITLASNGEAERIGKYWVRGVLGRGGMGVVYEVDAEDDTPRALKTIETRFLELSDGAAAQRFRHEIKVLERLVHPGIVRLYDAGIARHPLGYELAYYVMEKLEGDTLVPGIKSGTAFPVDEALRVLGGLADALDYLQKNGVLHRDIKPGNVFLEKGGRVVLVDFGLARSQEFTRLTLAGQIVGTFSYMSPERLAGQAVDVAADVFAAGVVFFQMLTGRHPFGSGTPPELMAAIHRGVDWPESFSRLERSAELRPLVTSMLAVEARTRPAPQALVERVRVLRQVRRSPARSAAPITQPSEPKPPVTVLIEASPSARPRDPAAAPAPPRATATLTDGGPRPAPVAAEVPRASAPVTVRSASGGPSWMMLALVSGSVACLAFTVGLLVGHGVRRAPNEAPASTAAPREDPTASRAPASSVPAVPPPPTAAASAPEASPATAVRAAPTATAASAEDSAAPEPDRDDYPALMRAVRDAARRADRDALIRYGKAAIVVNPASADAHRLLADAYAEEGDRPAALRHYKQYLACRPKPEDEDQVRTAIKALEPRRP